MVSTSPAANLSTASDTAAVTVTFDRSIDPATLTAATVKVNGSWSGLRTISSITYDGVARRTAIRTTRPFLKGEPITVVLTSGIRSATDGSPMPPYQFGFTVARSSRPSAYRDTSLAMSVSGWRSASAADFDGDGDMDIALVNQGGSGIMANDGTGHFSWTPAWPNYGGSTIGIQDLDGDGHLDMVTFDGVGEMSFLWGDGNLNFTQTGYSILQHDNDAAWMTTVFIADLNNDGLPDLIFPNGNGLVGRKTFILMNKGGRSWDFKVLQGVGGPPIACATGDIDGDGDIDLVLEGAEQVSILKNDGAGNFTLTAQITHYGDLQSINLYDVDRNGSLDLVLVNKEVSYDIPLRPMVEVLKNDGTGTFTAFSSYGRAYGPNDSKIADIDGDGLAEILTANSSTSDLVILKNDGTGRFSQARRIPCPTGVLSVLPNDFDGDGDVDLGLLTSSPQSVIVRWNKAVTVLPRALAFGTLRKGETASRTFTIYNDDPTLQAVVPSIASSDPGYTVNPSTAVIPPGDSLNVLVTLTPTRSRQYAGTLTVTVSAPETSSVRISLDGWFDPVVSVFPPPNAPSFDTSMAFSAALSFDVQASSLSTDAVSVVGDRSGRMPVTFDPSAGPGTLKFVPARAFQPNERISVTLTTAVRNSAGDSLPKPFVWTFRTRTFQGTGLFKAPRMSAYSRFYGATVTGDFNGDGYDDVAVANLPAALHIYLNDGRGGLKETQTFPLSNDPGAMAVLDLDNDGDLDIVLSYNGAGLLKAVNDGKGSFTLSTAATESQNSIGSISVGDVNGDGWMDLLVSWGWVYLNDHHGLFTLSLASSAVGGIPTPELGDIDGDGTLDVVGNDPNTAVMSIWHNDGRGSFTGPEEIPLVSPAASVTLADFNGDGKLDIAAGLKGSPNLAVLLNQGNGTFALSTNGGSGSQWEQIHAQDIDSDGDLDLLVRDATQDSLFLFTNRNGDFTGAYKRLPGFNWAPVAFGDLDHNGSPDYVYTNSNSTALLRVMNRSLAPDLTADTTALAFDSVMTSRTRSLRVPVGNESIRDTLVYRVKLALGTSMQVPRDTLRLAAGDTSSFIVTFAPQTPGAFLDSVIILSNDPKQPRFAFAARGVGVAPPAPPDLLTPADSAGQLPVPVTLTWSTPAGVLSYHVQVFKDSLNGRIILDTLGLPATRFVLRSLPHDSAYVWRAASIINQGEGPFGRPSRFTTWRSGPAGLTATPADSQSILLRWRKSTTAKVARYFVYKGPVGRPLALLDSTATDTTYLLSKLRPGDWFAFSVASADSARHMSDTSAHCQGAVPLFALLESGPSSLRAATGHWGDFDNDNKLDLLVTGVDSLGNGRTEVYRNDGTKFTLVCALPSALAERSAEWGDFDRDGYLDFFTTTGDSSGYFVELWHNIPGAGSERSFARMTQKIPGKHPAWIDFDNDGDPDLLLDDTASALYRNGDASGNPSAGAFTPAGTLGPSLGFKTVGDVNGDGRPDFAGVGPAGVKVYQNGPAGSFPYAYTVGREVTTGAALWGDFNDDGRPDLLYAGSNTWASGATVLYNYQGYIYGSGIVVTAALFNEATLAAADLNGSGALDVYAAGTTRPYLTAPSPLDSTAVVARLDESTTPAHYVDCYPGFPVTAMTQASFADLNNDGKLEAFAAPLWGPPGLYRAQGARINTPPSAPSGLHARFDADTLIMSWQRSADAEQAGKKSLALTYNLYVDSVGGRSFLSGNADRLSGFRRLAQPGNASQDTTWRLTAPVKPGARLVWSVQAVDHGFAGSAFAGPDTITRGTSGTSETGSDIPREFALHQNYPNPFNPSTTLRFAVPRRSQVLLTVFNTLGQRVATLVDEPMEAGVKQIRFDGTGLASGVYFYRFQAHSLDGSGGDWVQIRTMVLLK